MTCIRDSNKLRKMSLGYINGLMRRSSSGRNDVKNQQGAETGDSDEEKSIGEKPLKTGFLYEIKLRFQRRFTGVRSKYRSKMRKSSSINDRTLNDVSSVSNIDIADENAMNDQQNEHPATPTTTGSESNEMRTQSLSGHLLQLSKYGWYWGPITREDAEENLANQPEGSFLVRDSSNDHFLLSVSFRCSGRTFHSRIFHSAGKFSFYDSPEPSGFNSIPELIEHSITSSQSTVFCYSRPRSPGHPSFPVRLLKPVSRITRVRSLQYLCRFVIRQYTRVDQIKDLPLPSKICCYIEEGQF